MIEFVLAWALRSSLLILTGAALLRVSCLRDAATRLAVWTALLLGSLAVPFLSATLPRLPLVTEQKASAPSFARPFHVTPVTLLYDGDVPIPPAAASGFDWLKAAGYLYAMVAVMLLLRIAIGIALSLRLLRRSRRTKLASVLESDEVSGPVTVGIVRPAILLPLDWREWDRIKLGAVLAHERSHIQRRDPAVQLLSAIHRALLWISPLSWMLDRWIVRTAEEASDDAAIAATTDRVAYAEVLLGFLSQRATPVHGIAMARYDRPERRIDRVLEETSLSRGVTRGAVAMILILGCPLAYLAAAASPQKEQVIKFPSLPALPSAPEPIQIAQAQTETPSPRPLARPAPSPTFDAVSIKSLPSSGGGRSGDPKGPSLCHPLSYTTGMVSGGATASKLIQEAYGLSPHQISGGPAWLETDRYCIEAKSAGPAEKDQLVLMLQSMLADRFKLVVRQESKEMPVYLMTVSKPGRLFEVKSDLSRQFVTQDELDAAGYKFYHQPDSSAGGFFLRDTLQSLADFLSRDKHIDRPVLDRTGLTGTYLLVMRLAEGESVLIAAEEQFGLKIEPAKAPLPAIAIESVERPSAN